MSAPAIALERARFAYPEGGFALAVEDLRVARGERVACVGPSGSGKTTLIELACGVRAPSAGRVLVLGADLGALGEAGRRAFRLARIGLVFQELELLPYLSALENVLLPFRLGAGRLDGAARARARALLDEAGIGGAAERTPARLSQGERRRVAVCRALATDPEVVVCDEATASLDPESAARVLDLVLRSAERRGAAVLFATHDPAALPRFDRAVDVRALAGEHAA